MPLSKIPWHNWINFCNNTSPLDQVWSILPVLELTPLHRSRCRQKGAQTFIFDVGVIPFVALDTKKSTWATVQQGDKPHSCSSGGSKFMSPFIYFAKCVTSEIYLHYHKASNSAFICVPWASELFGKSSDFSHIEFQLKCCLIPVNEKDNS